eukprot:5623537-Prymnesium_polylepis.1
MAAVRAESPLRLSNLSLRPCMGVAVRLAWNRAAQPVPGGSRREQRCFVGAGCAGHEQHRARLR